MSPKVYIGGKLFDKADAKISVYDWWVWNQIPVTLGNIVGGALFTGIALYATYKPAKQMAPMSSVAPQVPAE